MRIQLRNLFIADADDSPAVHPYSRCLPISIPVFPLLFLFSTEKRRKISVSIVSHRQPRKARLCGRANLRSPVHEHLDALLENRATGSIAQFDVVIAGLQREFLEFAHGADEAAIHVDACVLQAGVDLHFARRLCDIA